MTETIISSATKEIRIGFDQPFVIIGERINPTGRKMLAKEMAEGDFSGWKRMPWPRLQPAPTCLTSTQAFHSRMNRESLQKRSNWSNLTDVPLSIDSSIVAALEAGLKSIRERPCSTR